MGDVEILVDATGATQGGAARFLDELERYLERTGRDDVLVLQGADRMNLPWLVRREREVRRHRPDRVVALNNISFQTGADRTVLLRNALHFPMPSDELSVSPRSSRLRKAQSLVIRTMARRADRIVVPTDAMRERVSRHLGSAAAGRIEVMPHPLTAPTGPESERRHDVLLCPVIDAPYKRIPERLAPMMAVLGEDRDLELRVTVAPDDLPADAPEQVVPIGVLSERAVIAELETAGALVFPLELEAFGYPLAEARVRGIPVMAPPSALAAEVGGESVVPCDFTSQDSIRAALEQVALMPRARPSENPFDPERYFATLFDGAPWTNGS